MVYCSKCGTKNEDAAVDCVKCGASLSVAPSERGSETLEKNWEEKLEKGAEEFGRRAEEFGKSMENECFGLPRDGAIFGLILGLMIVIFGLQQLFGLNIDVGPFALTVLGLLIIAGAIYGFTRSRSG